jgi:plasmid maintenance system killer protein
MSQQSLSYQIILLERQYLANLEAGLRTKIQMLQQAKKANQYDVNANRELPLCKADHKEVSQLLLSYNNIINCRLQDLYKFEFKSFKVHPLPSEEEQKETETANTGPTLPVMEFSKEADDNQNQ